MINFKNDIYTFSMVNENMFLNFLKLISGFITVITVTVHHNSILLKYIDLYI